MGESYEKMKAHGPFAEAGEIKRKRTLAEQIAWAQVHIPDEPAPFVVSAAWMLASLGKPVTVEAIRERLQATGRAAAQQEGDAA